MASAKRKTQPLCVFRTFLVSTAVCGLLLAPATSTGADDAGDKFNFGVGMYKQQRWKLAAETFREYLKTYPKHPKVPLGRLYYGLALVNLEQYEEARAQLRSFVKNNPKSRYLPDAMYRVAECSYLLDELKTAEAEFQRFLKQHPKHDFVEWALPYLGDTQLRLSKPQQAAEEFKKLLEQFPKSRMTEDAKFGLARALESLEKPADAIAVYRELAATPGSDRAPQAQLKLGNLYFDGEQFTRSANAYVQLERRFPKSPLVPLARLNAGYSYYQLGDYRKAIEQFELAAEDKEQSYTAGYWKAISYKHLGEYANASALLKSVFEADPKGPLTENVLHQWADSEMRLGRLDSARELFLRLVDGWPKSELADDSLHFAAEAALDSGRLDEAETLVTRFRREYPQSSLRMHHQLLRGRLLDAKGGEANHKQAVTLFEDVLKQSQLPRTRMLARFHLARVWHKLDDAQRALDAVGPLAEELGKEGASPELADALVLQGMSFLTLERYEEASRAMTRYLELRPDGKQADQALATLALAEAHRGDKAAANSHLASLSKGFPQSPLRLPTMHRLAEIAYAAKDWQWAASLFGRLSELGADPPLHAAALSGLAWSQHQQQKYVEAAATFGRLVKQHPDQKQLAPEAAYMQGKSLQDAGKLVEAAAAYRAAFKAFAPDGPSPPGAEETGTASYAFRAGLQAARVLGLMENKVPQADAAYEELFKRFPTPEKLDKLLDEWALLNYEAGDYERSDEIFRRLVAQAPKSDLADNARLSLAESELIAGKLDSARKSLRDLESSPESDGQVREVALSHLIGIAVEKEDWKDVLKTSAQFTDRFPESKHRDQAEFYHAEAQLQLDDVAGAQETLLKLKRLRDDQQVSQADWFPRVWVLLAESYLRMKKYEDVRRTVEEFRDWDPKSTLLYQADEILGRSFKNQAQFEQARGAFRRAIDAPGARRTETAAKSQFLIAETYLIQKDYENALKEYLKVYSLYKFPQWQAPALYQAALCDEGLGHWKDAVRTYEDLLRDFPDSEFADKAKSRLPAARRKAG